MEFATPLMFDSQFLTMFTFKLKILVKNWGLWLLQFFKYIDFRIYFTWEVPNPLLPVRPFLFKIFALRLVTCTKFEVSCCYNFSNIHILLLANNVR